MGGHCVGLYQAVFLNSYGRQVREELVVMPLEGEIGCVLCHPKQELFGSVISEFDHNVMGSLQFFWGPGLDGSNQTRAGRSG